VITDAIYVKDMQQKEAIDMTNDNNNTKCDWCGCDMDWNETDVFEFDDDFVCVDCATRHLAEGDEM